MEYIREYIKDMLCKHNKDLQEPPYACAICGWTGFSKKQRAGDLQVSSKKAWLQERFADGLVFLKARAGKVLY